MNKPYAVEDALKKLIEEFSLLSEEAYEGLCEWDIKYFAKHFVNPEQELIEKNSFERINDLHEENKEVDEG